MSARAWWLAAALACAACTGKSRPAGVGGEGGGVEVPDPDPVDAPDAGESPDGGSGPALQVKEVLPGRGPTGGGLRVEIVGKGFMAGADRVSDAARMTQVRFGSNPAIDVEVIDDTLLSVKLPAGRVGAYDVKVTNALGSVTCAACFSFFEELRALSIAPAFGSVRGGTHVLIKGEGLTAPVMVLFAGRASPAVREVPLGLDVVVPAGAASGEVDVTLYGPGGIGQLRRAFRYDDPLRAWAVTPAWGSAGSAVSISGTGLERVTHVRFGAASVPVTGGTTLDLVAPAGGPGAVDVTLEAPGESWTVKSGFSYVGGGALTLYAVQPRVGGTGAVSVIGEGLDAAGLTVRVGGLPAAVVSQTPNAVRVLVPPGLPRVSDVEVTVGATAKTLAQAYTRAMSVESVTPSRGPATGGTAVLAVVQQLAPDAVAELGGMPVTALPGFTTPPGSGHSDLWVHAASDLENEAVLHDAFTYEDKLWLGTVQPARASIAGGARVTLYGAGFGPGVAVSFGAQRAKDVKIVDQHTLTCRVPRAEVGSVDVTVDTLAEASTLTKAFAFYDPRNTYGGLSGGAIAGTLNVTVLEPNGKPIPLAHVLLGVDASSALQGFTDAKGQITFSDASLVKAQLVSAWKEGFVATTIAGVVSENVTVLNEKLPHGPPPPPEQLKLVPITGRVSGFKAPRMLVPGEALQARVFVAQRSVYESVPFYGQPNRSWERWQIDVDGGEYRVVALPGVHTVYAILGIFNEALSTFEPVTMGIRRKVPATLDLPPTGMDIVLDMHLDEEVPVTIEGPSALAGEPAGNAVYVWMDLGGDGLIPNPYNWDTGMAGASKARGLSPSHRVAGFPRLDGENFIWMNYLTTAHETPYSIAFRRQPGDMTRGVTVGPMLDAPELDFELNGAHFPKEMGWFTGTSATPDMVRIGMYHIQMYGQVLRWRLIFPGTEQRMPLVRPIVDWLEDELRGEAFAPVSLGVKTPRFDASQWTYEVFDYQSWIAFSSAMRSGWSL